MQFYVISALLLRAYSSRAELDGRISWKSIGLERHKIIRVAVNPYKPGQICALGEGYGDVFLTNDSGLNWKRLRAAVFAGSAASDITFENETIAYVTLVKDERFRGIARTKDSGLTWELLGGPVQGLPIIDLPGRATAIAAVNDAAHTIYLAAGGYVYSSTNSGDLWGRMTQDENGEGASRDKRKLATVALAGRHGWGGVVFGGMSGVWFVHPEGYLRELKCPAEFVKKVAVDAADNVLAIAKIDNVASLYRFANDKWDKVSPGGVPSDVAADVKDTNIIAAVVQRQTGSELKLSTNKGTTWTSESPGINKFQFQCIQFDPKQTRKLIIGSNKGVWVGEIK